MVKRWLIRLFPFEGARRRGPPRRPPPPWRGALATRTPLDLRQRPAGRGWVARRRSGPGARRAAVVSRAGALLQAVENRASLAHFPGRARQRGFLAGENPSSARAAPAHLSG